MNPFNLLLVLALLGAILVAGIVVVSECRDAELVTLPATVVGKEIVVRERTETTTLPPCPACPEGQVTVVSTVVQEEIFFVNLDVIEGGATSRQRVEVSAALYRALNPGDAVEWRVLRGTASGRLCGQPEILAPEPAR